MFWRQSYKPRRETATDAHRCPTPGEETVQRLTKTQKFVLGAATLPMLFLGAAGGYATFVNVETVFENAATALGVVAAGEGGTLILALVYVGLTLLGQSTPTIVRLGLWVLPAVASGTLAIVAQSKTHAVVYGLTPLAMCLAAEGLGLLARRVVIYNTRVDMEAQRRNAEIMRELAYQQARAKNHPNKAKREKSEVKAWELARKVGVGDTKLGASLVSVQRDRMTEGADAALAAMFGAVTPTPAATAPVTPAAAQAVTPVPPVTTAVTGAPAASQTVTPPVTRTVTLDRPAAAPVTPPVTETVTGAGGDTETVPPAVTETVTEPEPVTAPAESATEDERGVTLEESAAVAGVTVPVAGDVLTDAQLAVVLRHIRYSQEPPQSYRAAVKELRDRQFRAAEERVRPAWKKLLNAENAVPGGDDADAEADSDTPS
ncbi:hypothetical protein [Streptomyces sp. SM12]|uniref:hypothetical protein n=1 Tax=Streptomyces sp. SM12 TaxID=1071602 RepID=UPI0021560ADC|nr:hypothetical protein [Streptomyces sp. SM12]